MLDLFLGYAFSFAVHEVGHIAIPYPCGGYFKRWDLKDFPGMIYMSGSRRASTCGVLAGPLTQISVSLTAKNKDTGFWKGVYYGGLLHMLVYSLKGGGDFASLERLTGLDEAFWKFYIGSMSLLGIAGVVDGFQVNYGSHVEYETEGFVKHRIRIALLEKSKQNLKLEADLGVGLSDNLEVGTAVKSSEKEKQRFKILSGKRLYKADIKNGRFLYTRFRKDFFYTSLYAGVEERKEALIPLTMSEPKGRFKLYPEVGIEMNKNRWHLKAFWSSFSGFGLNIGMTF